MSTKKKCPSCKNLKPPRPREVHRGLRCSVCGWHRIYPPTRSG